MNNKMQKYIYGLLKIVIVSFVIFLCSINVLNASQNDEDVISASSGWIFNSTTTHFYKVITGCTGWHDCEDEAMSFGGHLVTINNATENNWLVSTFGNSEYFWIGYSDENSEGNWYWISGETPTYTNWNTGEPSNSGDAEHYALINWHLPGLWNDGWEGAITQGIIERNDTPFVFYFPVVMR